MPLGMRPKKTRAMCHWLNKHVEEPEDQEAAVEGAARRTAEILSQ